MDLSALAPFAPLVLGPLAAGVTQIAKNAPAIPINSGNAMVLRATVMVLAILGSVLTAWANGTLGSMDWQPVIKQVFDACVIYATAIAAYEHTPAAPPPTGAPKK